jgi:hypothetical protein
VFELAITSHYNQSPAYKVSIYAVSLWLITEISLFIDIRIKRESLQPLKLLSDFSCPENLPF